MSQLAEKQTGDVSWSTSRTAKGKSSSDLTGILSNKDSIFEVASSLKVIFIP